MFLPRRLSAPGVGVVAEIWWSAGASRPYPESLPVRFHLGAMITLLKRTGFSEGAIFSFFSLN